MRNSPIRSLRPIAAIVLTGCQLITGGDRVCTTIAIPGIAVDVLDSVSGNLLPQDAVVYAREGAFADSAAVPAPKPGYVFQPATLAYERAGRYDVSVRSIDYREWRQTDVRVRDAGCHVQTAHLIARLVRNP